MGRRGSGQAGVTLERVGSGARSSRHRPCIVGEEGGEKEATSVSSGRKADLVLCGICAPSKEMRAYAAMSIPE